MVQWAQDLHRSREIRPPGTRPATGKATLVETLAALLLGIQGQTLEATREVILEAIQEETLEATTAAAPAGMLVELRPVTLRHLHLIQ